MDQEVARFKWLLSSGLMFLVSGCLSMNELRFAIWSRTVDASVIRAKESYAPREGREIFVEYQFADSDGTLRTERDAIKTEMSVPSANHVMIQHIPGVARSSRLLGNSQMGAVYTFLFSSFLLGLALLWLCREANRPIPRQRRRTK
jgi:hypothetical protein